MDKLVIAAVLALGSATMAHAQSSGTPASAFPNAAPHEIVTINGIPCRTILDRTSNQRVPVQCAPSAGLIGIDPTTTGSVLVERPAGAPVIAGAAAFPEAAPHEVWVINGVPCRTVLVPGTTQRVPVECR